MWDFEDIRKEMRRLDEISGMQIGELPIKVSSRMSRTIARCDFIHNIQDGTYSMKCFVFSEMLLKYGTEETFLDTVRHEYAHAYNIVHDHMNCGHNKLWKQAAIRFGANPRKSNYHAEFHDPSVQKKKPYGVYCNTCKKMYEYTGRAGIVKQLLSGEHLTYICTKCGKRDFSLYKLDSAGEYQELPRKGAEFRF